MFTRLVFVIMMECTMRFEVLIAVLGRLFFWDVTLVIGQEFPDFLKIIMCSSSWTAWPWSWRHYGHSKHWEILAQWHSITSLKAWIFGLCSVWGTNSGWRTNWQYKYEYNRWRRLCPPWGTIRGWRNIRQSLLHKWYSPPSAIPQKGCYHRLHSPNPV